MLQASWLPMVMQGVSCEIIVIDGATLQLLYANPAACHALHYDAVEIVQLKIIDLAPDLSEQSFLNAIEGLDTGSISELRLHTRLRRKDGNLYSVCLRLLHCLENNGPVYIAINDTAGTHSSRTSDTGSPMHAVVSGMPVLIFQFSLDADKQSFQFLSEGCLNLLGVTPDELMTDADRLLELVLPEDRPAYLESMHASAAALSVWNWEGRIWIEKWNDTKWINLRAMPRALTDGRVQWEGVMSNITASKSEQLELISSRQQLAELSAHIETVKEQERTRIAREIHDDMGGNLTAIKMALALLVRRLPENESGLREKAEYLDTLIDRTIESVHRIAGDLRPSVLDFGLVAAIAWQAQEFEKQTGITCAFKTNKEDVQIPSDHATALFRIVQEALANISKHAHADEVLISLMRKENQVRLEIKDNGRGLTPEDCMKPKSFGIRGMRERANALGCDFLIEGARDSGTRIALTFPLELKQGA